MATKKQKAKIIDGVRKPAKKGVPQKSPKSAKKVAKIEITDDIVKDAIVDTTPKETHININESSTITETPSEKTTPETKEITEAAEIEENKNPKDVEESEAVEIPVSTKDITIAISSPIAENFEDTDMDDDIEALINDVAAKNDQPNSKKPEDLKTAKASKTTTEEENPKMKKAKKSPKKAKPFRIISRLIAIIATGSLAALITRVITTGVLPDKYIWLGIGGAAIITFFLLFKAFRKKTHLIMLVFTNLLGLALTVASVFGFLKIDETMRFLDKNLNSSAEYSIYNVIVSKKSNYNSLDDVKGKTFHSISDFVDTTKLETAAKDQANATITYEDGITSLLKNALDNPSYIAVLNSGTYDATLENDSTDAYKNGLKVIGELKVEVEKTIKNSTNNLAENSFVLFISGIDTRSGTMVDKSLSDVNIVMAVNPKTKHILMVAIPRDYYVQLHGTSGLPDKLTHAGALGGLDLSMATIEDLLDIKFDHHLRVNFNAVVNLVDAIGGITVYSDVNYPINAYTDHKCNFNPGNNDLNGKCALAFARERYAYDTGDRHRGENQEQVIQKIIEKITKSSTLISSYSNILDALSGSFETSIATKDITSLVNMQLKDMSGWTIETYNLDGSTGGAYTYSYPSQQLSVMYPDQATIDTAKKKIAAVLEGVDYVDNSTSASKTTN